MKYIIILITLFSMTLLGAARYTPSRKVIKKNNTAKKTVKKKKFVKKKTKVNKVITKSETYKKAPAFTLMNSKRRFRSLKKYLKDSTKKYIYISFFTNSCRVCPRERVQLKNLLKKYHNFDLVFIASRIGKDETTDEFMTGVNNIVANESLKSEVLLDVYDVVAKYYGVKKVNAINVPRLFVIEVKTGNIVKDFKGYHADLERLLKDQLK